MLVKIKLSFGIPHFTSYYTITRYHHVVKSLSILYCNISSIIGANNTRYYITGKSDVHCKNGSRSYYQCDFWSNSNISIQNSYL